MPLVVLGYLGIPLLVPTAVAFLLASAVGGVQRTSLDAPAGIGRTPRAATFVMGYVALFVVVALALVVLVSDVTSVV